MERITVGEISVDVVRKGIKNIHLAVYPPDGRVRIAVPEDTSDETIRLFIVSRLSWIKRLRRRFEEQERLPKPEYRERESHYLFGQRYLLAVTEGNVPPAISPRSKTYIDMFIRPGTSFEKKHHLMNEWYRSQLKKVIPEYIEKWEARTDLKIGGWQVKAMKTLWGSCMVEKKRIWINLELAKKPLSCLEYIIVHEMVHLLERDHNERFTAHMDSFLPNWRQLRTELNKFPASHAEWKY